MDLLNWLLRDNGGNLALLAILIFALGYGVGRLHGYHRGYSHGTTDATDDSSSLYLHNTSRETRQRK